MDRDLHQQHFEHILSFLKANQEPADVAQIALATTIQDLFYLEKLLDQLVTSDCLRVHSQNDVQRYSLKRAEELSDSDPNSSESGVSQTSSNPSVKLSPSERRKLAELAIKGDKQAHEKAEDTLIKSLLGRIRKIANARSASKDDVGDLMQEGAIGALGAIKKFNLGIKDFDAFLQRSINNAIVQHIAEAGGTIRWPKHFFSTLQQIDDSRRKLRIALEREPTEEELSDDCSITVNKIRRAREYSITRYVVSLDEPLSSEDDDILTEETICSSEEYNADFTAERNDQNRLIDLLLATLSPTERQVLKWRYVFTAKGLTLEEIGKLLGISRQGVQRIEAKALVTLRKRVEQQNVDVFMGKMTEASSASGSKVSPTGIQDKLTAQLLEYIIANSGFCTLELATNELISKLDSRIQIFETEHDPVNPIPPLEVAYWIIKHAVAEKLVREACAGSELVLTETGLNWINRIKQTGEGLEVR